MRSRWDILKHYTLEIISLLFILLFVYAAVSKFLDFENFQVQIAQSPLLSSFASWVSYFVPIVELLIAVFLSVRKTRLIGLYAAFSLMTMFTIYIFIILNFSPFVPCSCGGILDKLSWGQHLLFNIVFCIIAIPAIFVERQKYVSPKIRKSIFTIIVLFISSTATMTLFFLISEDMFHHRNNFTRRFPVHPAEFLKDYSLSSTLPYIAGVETGKIYIGDIRDPLKITEIDVDLKTSTTHTITTDEPDRLFRLLQVVVKPPYFYLSDGLEAFAFKGNITDWKAKIWIDKLAYYNSFVPIDSQHAAIRVLSGEQNENVIGVMEQSDINTLILNQKLLDKQIDGIFDTDGKLLFNDKHQCIIYVYTYRNEYLITDPSLQSKSVANTIDTTSRAKIKVAYVKKLKASKLASPSRIVNKTAATEGDYLYVNSKLIGQFEHKDIWNEASIIDVYNILNKAYLFSFYLYDKDDRKISEFVVNNGKVYTIAGKTLTVYNLDPIPFQKNN